MSASAPRTNAMSVAMTMPQPCAPSPPALMATYSSAGTTIPPRAASAGTAAARRSRSSPSASSQRISSATM